MQVFSQSPRGVLNFNIQLLSGKNVVLVNCQGYESELFMPQIVRGRISFQNVIPNRRCCDQANLSIGPLVFKGAGIGTNGKSASAGSPSIQRSAVTSTPLARSTLSSGSSLRSRKKGGKENVSPPRAALMTPERVRCDPAQGQFSIAEDLDISVHSIEKSVFSSQMVLPHQLQLSDGRKESDLGKGPRMHTPPVRTYSRRETNGTVNSKSNIIWSPLQKKKKISSKISTTKGPQAPMKLKIRHRKLIVDNKKSLGSLSINKLSPNTTKKKIIRSQVTAKTGKQFEFLKTTAFDLLTTPTHRNVSKALNHQFQLACVDKVATTLPGYAELAPTSQLEVDREVKSLIAKQKRMDKTNSKSKLSAFNALHLRQEKSKRT